MWLAPVPEPLHPHEWRRPAGNLEYRVTSPHGPRSDGFHAALDIGNGRLGGPVVASSPGEVIAAGFLGWPWSQPTRLFASGNYGGLMVVALHGDRLHLYAHLATRAVSPGDRIAAGQRIGTIGETGSAIGQGHLHFGIGRGTSAGAAEWFDPWALIREGDMQLGGSFVRHVINRRTRTTVDAAFRATPARAGTRLDVLGAGALFMPIAEVRGEAVGTAADRDRWYYGVKTAGVAGEQVGCVHSSVLERTADGRGVQLEPIEPAGISATEVDRRITDELIAASKRVLAR